MNWIPLSNFCQDRPWPKLPTLRWIIYRGRKAFGHELPFIRKFGRKLLIDADKFNEWISSKEGDHSMNILIERRRDEKDKKIKQLDLFKETHDTLC